LFLALLGIRHVLDNRFPFTLPLPPSLSILKEVMSCIRFVRSYVVPRSRSSSI
jgi:hypothetical protein